MDIDCTTKGQSATQKFGLRFDRITEAGPDREFYRPRILVDGVPIPEKLPVDLWRLVQSLSESGPHNVFTCSCGISACAGIAEGVDVSHEGEAVRWRYRLPQSTDGFGDDADDPHKAWLLGSEQVYNTFDRCQAIWAVFEALRAADQNHGEGAEYPVQGFERHHIGELLRKVEEIFRGQPLDLANLPFDPATEMARWAEANESDTKGAEKWGK
jgi:hypothetical protein